MRTLIGIAVLLYMSSFASLQAKTYYIKLDIDAPAEQQDALVTYISRELRKSPDIQLVTSQENYKLSVVCMHSSAGVYELACSTLYVEVITLASSTWKQYVDAKNTANWDELISLVGKLENVFTHSVNTVGVNKLESMCVSISNTMNKYIEQDRLFQTQLNRATHDTSK